MGSINLNLAWMIAGTFAALTVGTAIRLVALRNSAADVVKKRLGSLRVWWVLALLWSVAALLGLYGAAALLAIASFRRYSGLSHVSLQNWPLLSVELS